MKRRKVNKNSKNLFYKILSAVLGITSAVLLGLLLYMDLLPNKYMIILVIAIIVFDVFNIVLLNIKKLKKKIKKTISVFSLLAILIMLIAVFYLSKTLGVLVGNGDSKYKLENYSVLVLKDSKYSKLEDIKNKSIGYYENSTGAKASLEYLDKKIKTNSKSYKASDTLVSDLLNSNVDAILIEDSLIDIAEEEHSDFKDKTKVIFTFSIKVQVESTLKDVNVTKESFAVYISGIDTYGKISSVSRSDVNIVMVVNPTTRQVLLISIPRDYYVQLHGTTDNKDKLTHAGIYGIDMSIKTIEDLLDMKINYYLKVNFTSVIDIVNALGGLDVYSEYTFISYSGYSFKKGYNKVNGEQALDFARTRKAFSSGDRQRGKNQQALIEAIIRKATSKSIITKYSSLLDAVNGKYQTNMSVKKITSLIKKQLNDMSPWTITSYSLTGKDSNNYTYTYNQLLYVMEPDEESITEAKDLIKKVLGDEKLDSSYNETVGNSNTVTKVPQKPTPAPSPEPPKEVPKDVEDNDEDKSDEKDENQDVSGDENDDILIPPIEQQDGNDTDKDSEDNNPNNNDSSSGDEEGSDDSIESLIPQS